MKPDFVQKEIITPNNRYCSSGHFAPEYFRRNGPNSDLEPIKFFEIISKDVNGLFCEPCLIVARFIANKEKKG